MDWIGSRERYVMGFRADSMFAYATVQPSATGASWRLAMRTGSERRKGATFWTWAGIRFGDTATVDDAKNHVNGILLEDWPTIVKPPWRHEECSQWDAGVWRIESDMDKQGAIRYLLTRHNARKGVNVLVSVHETLSDAAMRARGETSEPRPNA